jgi:hypothetical protein
VRSLCQWLAGLAVAGALGCGGSDPNKDLKPVDPNTPPLKPAREGQRQAPAGPSEKPPAPIIK